MNGAAMFVAEDGHAGGRGHALLAGLIVTATAAVCLAVVAPTLLEAPLRLRPLALLEDGWIFALTLVLAVLVSPRRALQRGDRVPSESAAGAVLALAAGVLLGLVQAGVVVLANRYLSLGMIRLALTSAAAIVGTSCLVAVAGYLVGAALLACVQTIIRREHALRLVPGLLPVLVIFVFVDYRLNRLVLPGLTAPASLAGNAAWVVACVVALWPAAWLQRRLSLPLRSLTTRMPVALLAGTTALPAVVLAGAALALPVPRPDRPSVIIVSIDTLRADHLGSYGYQRSTSPNLDRFAGEAVLFRNAIAPAPWTLPSHMSILTGIYPSGHGAVSGLHKLAPRFVTMAEILQQEGYLTVAFTDGGYLDAKFGYQGFDHFDDRGERTGKRRPARRAAADTAGDVPNERIGQRAAASKVDKAIAFLRQRRRSQPFLLFLHTYQVHCPYNPPEEWDRFSDPTYRGVVETVGSCAEYFDSIKPAMGPADFQHVIDKYDGEIAYTDAEIGRLFAELETAGLLESSVVVVTSDHGENLDDHLGYQLGHTEQLFDHTLRVPLILKAPDLAAGVVVEGQVESVDILPTVLALLGIAPPEPLDGASLVPAITTGARDREFAYSEKFPALRMIRSDAWKLIVNRQDHYELYDLVADPGEQRNVLTERLDEARRLRRRLDGWATEQERRLDAIGSRAVARDQELEARLRALGYVQ